MIGSRCTADCFFCPQDRDATRDKPPTAGGIEFDDPGDYADYLAIFGLKGVGISGGEPLLPFDKSLSFLETIKKRLGSRVYVWLYTNGDLATDDKLARLRDSGLDEIRFNIVHGGYALDRVAAACRRLDTVSVEVPAIPEDCGTVQERLTDMASMGVAHLNLHQLHATAHNYKNLTRRGYTFLHYPSEYPVPVFESEITALELLGYAAEKAIALPINYCSHAFKYRFQNAGARRRAASLGCAGFEGVTEGGYIRRMSVRQAGSNVGNAVSLLKQNHVSPDLWFVDASNGELSFHHSLLPDLTDEIGRITIRYFDVRTHAQGQRRIELNANRAVYVDRRLLAIETLAAHDAAAFRATFLQEERSPERPAVSPAARESLRAFAMWERIEEGFPEVY
jgi:pyruvate formate-lyase activating enzyme-like uncharacterized protein